MRVLFDHQIFQNQRFGGISRYFFELQKHLTELQTDTEISIKYSDNAYIGTMQHLRPLSPFSSKRLGKSPIGTQGIKLLNAPVKLQRMAANKVHTIKKLREGNFDVFHATYYDDYFLEHLGGKPYFITVYDLIHQIFPEHFALDVQDKNLNLLQNAAAIFAISHSTKKDLMDFFSLPEEKIVVTHLASNLTTKVLDTQFMAELPTDYILFVGNRNAYKNFYFFAEVFKQLSIQHPKLQLICTGAKMNQAELDFLKNLGIDNKVHTEFVDDQKLAALYQNAKCFVFPSLYEGFGIPVLEAFENNCPVIASNTSSLPEIGGDAALYFHPKNFSDMYARIHQILSDDQLRESKIRTGLFQLSKFSWKKTAEETLKTYKKFN